MAAKLVKFHSSVDFEPGPDHQTTEPALNRTSTSPDIVFSVPGGMTVDHLVDYLQTLRGEFDVVGRSLLEFVPDRTPQRDVLQTVIDALGV